MKNKNTGFTFVELIVVITILTILSTIGFMSYKSYVSNGEDTNRLVQLKDIHDGLERYSVNSRLPFPEDMIEIQANGNTYLYQGNLGKSIIQAIGYDGGGKDPKNGNYMTYMLGKNERDFQLMTFVDNAGYTRLEGIHTAYAANQDYASLFPKVIGKDLGIFLQKDTQIPIHKLEDTKSSGSYDVFTGTGLIVGYFTNDYRVDTSNNEVADLFPQYSCKNILSFGNSKGNGIYTLIFPDKNTRNQVYCDMETKVYNLYGWMLVTRSVPGTSYSGDFGWLFRAGSLKDLNSPYSLGMNIKNNSFDTLALVEYEQGYDISIQALMIGLRASHFDSQLALNSADSMTLYSWTFGSSCPVVGHWSCNNSRGIFFGALAIDDHYSFTSAQSYQTPSIETISRGIYPGVLIEPMTGTSQGGKNMLFVR